MVEFRDFLCVMWPNSSLTYSRGCRLSNIQVTLGAIRGKFNICFNLCLITVSSCCLNVNTWWKETRCVNLFLWLHWDERNWLNKGCFYYTCQFSAEFIPLSFMLPVVFTCYNRSLLIRLLLWKIWMNGFPPEPDLAVLCRVVGCRRYCHQPLCASFLHFLLPVWSVVL